MLPSQQASAGGSGAASGAAQAAAALNADVLELSSSLRSKEAGYAAALPIVYLDCTAGVAAALVANKTSRLTQATRTPRNTADALLADVAELLPSSESVAHQQVCRSGVVDGELL